ncbi:sulfatase [Actinomadura barringtoniae]|uniref:Sulfatase n=1 Tax=Actinomadura barringtoniae TaxID=1427535 RepID=A0A939PNR2_9ACTN|nr:sulfatase [Actinomadura barringtoniae]MBO2455732.1 sulfatase [Actinomadura barringtoniae]
MVLALAIGMPDAGAERGPEGGAAGELSAASAVTLGMSGAGSLMAGTSVTLGASSASSGAARSRSGVRLRHGRPQPNVIMIVTDDLDRTDLRLFPNIARLRREGTSLSNFFVSDSWCCPSRSTILRSQYVHSHGVRTNNPPNGGFPEFHARREDQSTIGTWMKSAGYRTGFVGKFLNGYPASAPATYVPPGWDDWHVPSQRHMYQQRDYHLVEQGFSIPYGHGPADHLDDVLARRANSFVHDSPRDKPFFLYLAPLAPHLPAPSAARHTAAFKNVKAPRPPSFNKAGTFKEPRWLRNKPKLCKKDIKRIDGIYRDRLRSMLSVNDMVGSLMKTLRDTQRLQNTYVIFTSDNGFHLGEHRLPPGKTTPYEEDIRIPFVIRGPGIPAGRSVNALAGTVDLAPTIAAIGGAKTPSFTEGRSLLPVLKGHTPGNWRKAMLMEFYAGKAKNHPEGPDCDTRARHGRGCPLPPTYAALRTDRYLYVEYVTGERQLYDLAADPYELRNLAGDPRLIGKDRPPRANRIRARLNHFSSWLAAYRSCKAATCRQADRG